MEPWTKFDSVRTASVEVRLENVLERKKEIAKLYQTLQHHIQGLCDSLVRETHITPELANEEAASTLDHIKKLYQQLDFPKALERERKIKLGSNQASNLIPLSPVLIVANVLYPLSSTLVPLAAAVASGAASITLSEPSLPETNQLLYTIIHDSLDREACLFDGQCDLSQKQTYAKFPFQVAILQDEEACRVLEPFLRLANPLIRVLKPSLGINSVIVDGSVTNLQAVATHIQNTILTQHLVPTTNIPRLCLVDELIADKIVELLQKAVAPDKAGTIRPSIASVVGERADSLRSFLGEDTNYDFVCSGDKIQNGIIVLRKVGQGIKLQLAESIRKVLASGSELLLIPCKSSDFSIDLLNSINSQNDACNTYVFASNNEAFYFQAFIRSTQVIVNEIPMQSIVTTAPRSANTSTDLPYTLEDFSVVRSYTQTVLSMPISTRTVASMRLFKLDLEKESQPKGGRRSYFEQGLILGTAMSLCGILGASFVIVHLGRRFFPF